MTSEVRENSNDDRKSPCLFYARVALHPYHSSVISRFLRSDDRIQHYFKTVSLASFCLFTAKLRKFNGIIVHLSDFCRILCRHAPDPKNAWLTVVPATKALRDEVLTLSAAE